MSVRMAKEEADIPEGVGVYELRRNLRRILDRVTYFGQCYVITRNGEAVAVLVALEDFRRLVGAPGAPAEIGRR